MARARVLALVVAAEEQDDPIAVCVTKSRRAPASERRRAHAPAVGQSRRGGHAAHVSRPAGGGAGRVTGNQGDVMSIPLMYGAMVDTQLPVAQFHNCRYAEFVPTRPPTSNRPSPIPAAPAPT